MKKYLNNNFKILAILLLAVMVGFTSCKKDSDGSPDIKADQNPYATTISPATAGGGTVLTLTGVGIGDIRSIVFDKKNVPAVITSTLNTEKNLVFRVPDTAFGGNQNIVFTNSLGKSFSVAFNVIALPTITDVYPIDFQAGSIVTIKGSNLDDVSKVVLKGTTDAATIVSQTRQQLVLKMPASSVDRAPLSITNTSGTVNTSQEFINIDKAAPVFRDVLESGFQSWSWGGNFDPSPSDKVTGTGCMLAAYDPAGSWGGMQLGGGSISLVGKKYFAFWAKGVGSDVDLQFWLSWNGGATSITAPANKWTYFRYELATSQWSGLSVVDNVTFQIKGAGKTVLFDNIVFVK